jgi:predicted Rossmann-fold nucleotide-binding protein
LLNSCDYFDPLQELINHSIREGFTRTDFRQLLTVESNPDVLIDRMIAK